MYPVGYCHYLSKTKYKQTKQNNLPLRFLLKSGVGISMVIGMKKLRIEGYDPLQVHRT